MSIAPLKPRRRPVMNRWIVLGVVIASATMVSPARASETTPAGRSIKVSGTALVEVTPDMVTLALVVKTVAPNVETIADQHLATVAKVRTAAEAQQISRGDVRV